MRIRLLLLLLAIVTLGVIRAGAQDQIETGTVNIILANSDGIVVLTDSKQTQTNAEGKSIGSTNGQKLIRLDDESVVALAGFAGAPSFQRLDIMGLLADFGNQLAAKNGKISFTQKLKTISFLIGLYMDAFANVREVVQPGQNPSNFRLHIFVAGFDTDGIAKIGSMWLRANSIKLADGRMEWNVGGEPQVEPVGDSLQDCRSVGSLQYCVAGWKDSSDRIMDNPQAYNQNPAIRRLPEAGGSHMTMSVSDLEALAKVLSAWTSKEHPDKVGGPDQVAILHDRRISKFDEPYPSPLKPMPIGLIMDVTLPFGPGGSIRSPNASTIYIRDVIMGNQHLVLDGNFFFGNEIQDSTVIYNGGATVFDESNKVVNSILQLNQFGPSPDFLRDFKWSRCIPLDCDFGLPKNRPLP
jgi:hypothetical protein